MRMIGICLTFASALFLAACQSNGGYPSYQQGGALIGALAGGLAASQLTKSSSSSMRSAATGLGTVLGMAVGNEIGRSMDEADRMEANNAMQRAARAPVGQTITWSNPDSGNHGQVTTTREGYTATGNSYCREFNTVVTVGGETEEAYGTACRRPDGTWQVNS